MTQVYVSLLTEYRISSGESVEACEAIRELLGGRGQPFHLHVWHLMPNQTQEGHLRSLIAKEAPGTIIGLDGQVILKETEGLVKKLAWRPFLIVRRDLLRRLRVIRGRFHRNEPVATLWVPQGTT